MTTLQLIIKYLFSGVCLFVTTSLLAQPAPARPGYTSARTGIR